MATRMHLIDLGKEGRPADRAAAASDPGSSASRIAADGSPIVELAGVTHSYGEVTAVRDVSLSVRRGEFLTLLGPSGSGKTTLMRIIAGLEQPTRADVMRLAGADMRGVPANERNVATVFQHFALFPHMSVGENVEFGLRVRRRPTEERRRRALEALAMVRLGDKYDRRIHQLSGGERQRVALARALVTEPDVLLLDEPLGSLDEKLRVDMQLELIDLQRRLGTTFLLVTHSQEEALTMSDRIILMRDGRIEQEDAPDGIFNRPRTRFAAEFMGVENLFEVRVIGLEGEIARVRAGDVELRGPWRGEAPPEPGAPAFLAVRAEQVRFATREDDVADGRNALPCRLGSVVYKGKYRDLGADTPLGRVTGRVWQPLDEGFEPVLATWDVRDCLVGPA